MAALINTFYPDFDVGLILFLFALVLGDGDSEASSIFK